MAQQLFKHAVRAPGQQPCLTVSDYERFQDLVLSRTGMLFGNRRRGALAKGVLAMAAKRAGGDVAEYYRLMGQTRTDSRAWDELINELTIGETYFFRDSKQFNMLRNHILPQLIKQHDAERRLRIWSAGCASGEEPFSIAMLLDDIITDPTGWHISILATDINREVLAKAEKARFRQWSFRQTSPLIRSRYFKAHGEFFQLCPDIRNMVTFGYLNLSEDTYPSLTTQTNAMDLILWRNVAIYQSEAMVASVVDRFYKCLLPEGWLMVGAAETSIPVYDAFATRNITGSTVFQKTDTRVTDRYDTVGKPFTFDTEKGGTSTAMENGFAAASPGAWDTHAGHDLGETGTAKVKGTPWAEPERALHGPPWSTVVKPVPEESPTGPELFVHGMALLKQKRFRQAMHAFEECIALNPDHAPAFLQIARVQANQGKLAEARTWCLNALERDPVSCEAHYTLALICQEAGELEAALKSLKKAVFVKADFVLAHFSLAMLYRQQGMTESFQRHKRQAVRMAARIDPQTVLTGSDDLTAGQLLTMARVLT